MKGRPVVCRSPADRGWLESSGGSEALTAVSIGAQWWALGAGAEQGGNEKEEAGNLHVGRFDTMIFLTSSFCLQTSLNNRTRLDDFLQDNFGLEEGFGF